MEEYFVMTMACDITDISRLRATISEASEVHGPISVLVNNAAANFPVPAEDMSPNAWRTVVDITLTTPL